jgi:RsiW-degrading membrane proteinase PrsW (M82 family)
LPEEVNYTRPSFTVITRTGWTGWCSLNRFWTQVTLSELCHRRSPKCKIEQRAIICKLVKTELCFFALHFYSMRSIYKQSFMLISLIVLELLLRQSSKCKNEQRAIIWKLAKTELWFFCIALLHSMRSIYQQSFMLISLIVLELCSGQSSKRKNKQRAIIWKFVKTELWFFCNALLLNEIYLPQNFMLISLIVLELCPWQSSKCKNEQRAIWKLVKTELCFYCTALLSEIYLPT